MEISSPETPAKPDSTRWLSKDIDHQPEQVETLINHNHPLKVNFDPEKIIIEPLSDHFYDRYQLLRKIVNDGMDKMAELVKEEGSFEEILDSFDKIHTVTKSWGEYTQSPSEKNLSEAIGHDVGKRIGAISTSLEGTTFDPEMRKAYLDIAKTESRTVKPAVESWDRILSVLRGEEAESTGLNEEVRLIREINNLIISSQEGGQSLEQINVPGGLLPVIVLNLKSNSDSVAKERGLFPSLKCSVGAVDENGQTQLVFRAWDKAGGFSEEMFDNGRLKVGESKRQGGTGVGLQTVDSFLEAMNGTAVVGNWSEPDTGKTQGAYFEFKIPLEKSK
jgi:signal transduction histidine kinase